MITIERDNDRFFVPGPEGGYLAEITFRREADHTLVIDHTFVSDALGGQGVGKRLVHRVAELAREEGVALTATCWFAVKVLALDSR